MDRKRLGRREVVSGGLVAAALAAAAANGAAAVQLSVRPGGGRDTADAACGDGGMKVFLAHDGALRVRIGHENLGSESLGPWYGGTGAVRLRQVYGTRFWAYRLDDHGYRGTAALPEAEYWRVREHLPSARIAADWGGTVLEISSADLVALQGAVVPLTTRVTRFGAGMVAMFGDFQIGHTVDRSSLGLFHLGEYRFNGFRTGFNYTALRDGDVTDIAALLPSARLLRDGPKTLVELGIVDIGLLLWAAEEA